MNSHRHTRTLVLLTVLFSLLISHSRSSAAEDFWNRETAEQRNARMEWWRDARFGMFIHWGLYAVPAGEWQGKTNYAEWIRHRAQIPIGEYDRFVGQFNPVKFDAEQWVQMAKQAGMKYLVITSKHHDGFCLWPSELTEFDVESTPFQRDIMGELSRACQKHGLKFCMYHSIMDWHHPDYLPRRSWEEADRPATGADYDRYITYMKGQLKELVQSYDPGVLWFDGEWESTWTHEMGCDLYDYVRSLKPRIIINNRVDKGRQGMEGLTKQGEFRGDFGTPEQQIPATGISGVDWETCMTMNNHWGWNRHDKNWKSEQDLIHKLVDIASKGGNFLLNIGPKADGTFPEESVQRLAAIGRWMQVHGDAIYGTSASPTSRPKWGRITAKTLNDEATRLYLNVFDWPQDGRLDVLVSNQVRACYLLSNPSRKFDCSSHDAGLTVRLSGAADDPHCSVVVLDLEGSPQVIEKAIAQDADGSATLKAIDAEIHAAPGGQAARYEAGGGKNNIGYWMDPKSWVDWKLRVTSPGMFDVVALVGAQAEGVKLAIEVGDQRLIATARNTGSWDTYAEVPAGKVDLAKAGVVQLKVKPVAEGWQPVNLRSIRLVPCKQ